MTTMPSSAHARGILLHHLPQGLDPGRQAEAVHARRTSSTASPKVGSANNHPDECAEDIDYQINDLASSVLQDYLKRGKLEELILG